MTDNDSASGHLVLAAIESSIRAVSIRVLGGYAESLGVRTTLLVIIKKLATIGSPVAFTPREIQKLYAYLEREKVTHLGFYLMTATLKPYALLTAALREAGYRGIIMAGGVHVSLEPRESLVDGADYAVAGPGELPLKMILAGADPQTIPGLVWRNSENAVVVNEQSPDQDIDLDTLPFPLFRYDRDRALIEGRLVPMSRKVHKKYGEWQGRYYDLITSRGCMYNCAYCCRVDKGKVRRSSVDRVIGELAHLKKSGLGITGINIQDDEFYSGSDEWVEEFCRRMKTEIQLPFIIRMIPKFVTPERIRLYKDAGLSYVTMGLEGSDRLNKLLYKRPETNASFLKAAQTILASGLHLSIDIIIDNPYETRDDLRQVARTLNALPRGHWNPVTLSLTPFPGTPLYKQCVKENMLKRFATDPYDSMLKPSREGGYRTPQFWLDMYHKVLRVVKQPMASKLIDSGPDDPAAAAMVARLAKMADRAQAVSRFIRNKLPPLYWLLYRLRR